MQARPVLPLFRQPAHIVGHHAARGLDASMILLDLEIVPEGPIQSPRIGAVEPQPDRLRQAGLVILDAQHIIGPALHNLHGDIALAAHRINGDHAPLGVQCFQQFCNRCDLVAFLSAVLDLPQRESRRGAPRRYQVNRAALAIMRAAHAFAVNCQVLSLQGRTQQPYPA